MKLLSRIVMVFALLGVLAYGSYAFGMYVLSAKLFGDNVKSQTQRNISRSTTEASAVTRQTGWKGDKPRVEVKVLPGDASDASAPLPAYVDEDSFQKSAPRERRAETDSDSDDTAPQGRLGKREFDSGSPDYSLGDENKRKKRSTRRRRKSSAKKETKPDSKPDDAQVSPSPAPEGEGRSDNSSRENSSSDSNDDSSSGSDRAVIRDNSSSSRERETPRETSKPRESSRRRTKTTRTKPRDSSPVPRPEGSRSSGGDNANISSSPVPKPE